MFTHQRHMQHLLRPEHYLSEAQHRRELRHLFRPAWHPVATVDDLARPGDFLTFDLLETPFLVRNFDGELRAFLNVCAHRHCRITDQARGHAERLRCQYHGWEYDRDGATGRIPEARTFRPWDREHACLTPFRVATCGDLVFVHLGEGGGTLREWLGPLGDVWQRYGGEFRHAATWEHDFPCNWKVVLENSLESYHIPEVHPRTFRKFPDETNSWHELTDHFTSFKTVLPPWELPRLTQTGIVRGLGGTLTHEYWHRVRHPHTTGSSLDSNLMMQCVFPTGPTTCRYRSIFFTLRGTRGGPLGWALARSLRVFATAVARRVIGEDASIYTAVQRGLRASPYPGVIGTREERVYQFQKYVLDHTAGASEPADDLRPLHAGG
jgi:phenylpropionate dioxygenase-like ring-hydroxylating dioxygenase large terminal subunit